MSNGIWLKDDGPKSVAGHFVCPLTQKKSTGNGQLLFVCLSVYVCVFLCVCVCLSVCVYGRVLPEGVHWAWHEKSRSSYIFKRFVWIMKPFTWQQQLQHTSLCLTFPSLPPLSLPSLISFSLRHSLLSPGVLLLLLFFFPRFCYVRHLWAYLNIWASLPAMSIKRETHSDRIAGERR